VDQTLDGQPDLTPTRQAWHAVAEHVLAAALHRATGRIGLRAAAGGFATPPFPATGGSTTIRIDQLDLVVIDPLGERRSPLTTLRAAADFVGVEAGAPADVYTPATPLDLDRPLTLDPEATACLGAFFAMADDALARLRSRATDDDPATVQLWPEHFDLATTIGQVNYGGSPGDDDHPLPYLYVGPWSPPGPDGGFWNEPFGASLTADADVTVDRAVAFLTDGRTRAADSTGD
jgi:hypothetical protein